MVVSTTLMEEVGSWLRRFLRHPAVLLNRFAGGFIVHVIVIVFVVVVVVVVLCFVCGRLAV